MSNTNFYDDDPFPIRRGAPQKHDKPAPTAEEQAARLKTLLSRFDELNRRKISNDVQLTEALKREQRLVDEAIARYGVSDPTELLAMHDRMVAENEARLEAFEQNLNSVQSGLDELNAAS